MEFVRGTGPIIERKGRGLNNWVGENHICRINKGIRPSKRINVGDTFSLKNVSSHFYATENYNLSKYEFVYVTQKYGELNRIDSEFLRAIVTEILSSNITVEYTNAQPKTVTQSQFGSELVRYHLSHSTLKSNLNPDHSQPAKVPYILSCIPQIYFQLELHEVMEDWSSFKPFGKDHGQSELRSILFNHQNRPVRVWVHDAGESAREDTRRLRMSIMRLHAEYECLNNVFKGISNDVIAVGEKSIESDLLQAYLNRAIKTFLRDQISTDVYITDADYIDLFSKTFSNYKPGELDQLKNKIQEFNFRNQIQTKTYEFINQKIVYMKSKYEINNSQVGAVGDNATSNNNEFIQINSEALANLDYEKLLAELSALKAHLKENANSAEELETVMNVAKAEEAAKKKEGSKVMEYLKAGGKWLLDTGTKIGVSLVTELAKAHMNG